MMTPEMADMPMNFSRSLHEKSDCFRHSHVSNAECCRQAQYSVAWQQGREKLMTSYRAAWPSSSLAREPAKQQLPQQQACNPTKHSTRWEWHLIRPSEVRCSTTA